jgi:hypothetical protein
VIKKLLNLALLVEIAGAPNLPVWRREEDGDPIGLVITGTGLEAIGLGPEDQQQETLYVAQPPILRLRPTMKAAMR